MDKEYKPQTIEIKTIDYWEDYKYWKQQEKLVIWREIIKKETNNTKLKTWRTQIPWWYINYSITWIWFKPKIIQVIVQNNNKVAWGTADENNQQCIYVDNWNYTTTTTRLFRFDNINVWFLVSIDNDWFTVKSDLVADMIYTCIW
jgi:hypothetical protein